MLQISPPRKNNNWDVSRNAGSPYRADVAPIGPRCSTGCGDARPVVICRDRQWWRAEARRAGTDWDSIIAQHLEVLRRLRIRHNPDGGTT
jgi:hypothetical protein